MVRGGGQSLFGVMERWMQEGRERRWKHGMALEAGGLVFEGDLKLNHVLHEGVKVLQLKTEMN